MSGFIKINGVEVVVPVSGPDKLLGRVTSGAGGHEEITISGLPAETTPAAGDLLLIEVGGVLKKLDVDDLPGGGSGTVTSASVVSANGLAGTVATATTTPAITLSTTVSGVLKGNGTAISAAANSDLPAMSATVGGAVPTPPNNTTTFLRGDGTFAAPAGGGGDIVNGGNTGAVVIGTNNATTLSFETNNVVRQVITGGASTGGALTITDVTANTATVETNITTVVNSSGTAAAGLGQRHLLQLESTTTNAQDAAAIDAVWTTATHASRTADIVFNNVNNAAALAETLRIAANGNLTSTSLVTNTNTAADVLTIRTNSTGTPAANFGGSILFQGETATTNNRDMARIRTYYSDPDNSFPTAAIGMDIQDGNGSGLATTFKFLGTGEFVIGTSATTSYRRTGIQSGTAFNINTTVFQDVNIGSPGSSNVVTLASGHNNTSAILLDPANAAGTSNRITIGTVAATNTSGDKYSMNFMQGYTASSGTGTLASLRFGNTINQTSTASGVLKAIEIAPTLTSVTGQYRALDIAANHANAKGVYQSGASTTNNLVGKTMLGATTAPAEMLDVTGNVKVIGQKYAASFALTDAATVAVDWNNSNVQAVTLAGNRTFTFANPKSGAEYVLLIKQDATGTRTVTWPTVRWQGGSPPTLTVTANKTDIIRIFYDGTSYYGNAALNY